MNQKNHRTLAHSDKQELPRTLKSTELFAGHSKVKIEHEGTDYLLQITRTGKLILTK